ncbi:MAG: phage shock protein operon transcriptional activator [Gammaproteobacteria bacterium]|nr:phage shock protein operon transcriptional activator [Gammaproteobacteria bacterium]
MDPLAPIPGEHPVFLDVVEHVARLALIDRSCLVIGERGTGKELFCTRLHFLSSRWSGPLIKVNCGAFTESLLESELFGHEKGAFTGAERRHVGCFERADGGTLVLDEIASASSRVQDRLLRVVEYGELMRVGGTETIAVDVRVVGVANADLVKRVQEDTFRADLLDRLAFDVIAIPPLRARGEDILTLAHSFAVEMVGLLGREVFHGFSERAKRTLLAHHWPGNVRELKNTVERSLYRAPSDAIVIDDIVLDPFASPWRVGAPVSPAQSASSNTKTAEKTAFTEAVADFEKRLLEQAMLEAEHSQTEAANRLGLSYHQLRRLLAKHRLKPRLRAS